MRTNSMKEIKRILVASGDGDQSALEEMVPSSKRELHRLARHYMNGERPGHMLQTSTLAMEAYIRLIDWKKVLPQTGRTSSPSGTS